MFPCQFHDTRIQYACWLKFNTYTTRAMTVIGTETPSLINESPKDSFHGQSPCGASLCRTVIYAGTPPHRTRIGMDLWSPGSIVSDKPRQLKQLRRLITVQYPFKQLWVIMAVPTTKKLRINENENGVLTAFLRSIVTLTGCRSRDPWPNDTGAVSV